ncbi:MAG: alpha/beta hydrolase [Candidatus Dormibacteria bacterium]
MRARALALAGALSLAVGIWTAVCTFVYWRAFGFRRRRPVTRPQLTPADLGIAHETLDVRTPDGLNLVAWYLPGDTPAAVVVSGGYRGRASDVLGISAALNRAGFHVVAYGWRGTPGSDSAAHTLGAHERHDLLAVIDAVAARLGDIPVGLLGYSLGGSVSISVGADDSRVRAVCADSAFADPSGLMGDRVRQILRVPAVIVVAPVLAVLSWRTGARLADFRPIDAVSRVAPRPLLLIHGDADGPVPVDHSERLFAAASEPKELWRLPGVTHAGAYGTNPDVYVRRVRGFFEEALLRPELHLLSG